MNNVRVQHSLSSVLKQYNDLVHDTNYMYLSFASFKPRAYKQTHKMYSCEKAKLNNSIVF